MAARTRARPRGVQGTRTSRTRSRSRSNWWKRGKHIRPELAGIVIAIAALAMAPFFIDVGAALATTRDGIARTFGAGIFLLIAAAVFFGIAIARRAYENPGNFARKTGGWLAIMLFVWGALAMNTAQWSVGSVNFVEVSLGGRLGQWFIDGFLGKVAWITFFVIGMALLAPRFSGTVARNTPLWIEEAWERRWPHRALGAIGALIQLAFKRPQDDESGEPVIGGTPGPPSQAASVSYEEVSPIAIRPNIDAASPRSLVGAGAAVQFANGTATADSESVADEGIPEEVQPEEEPEEPHQLGLAFDERNGWQLPPTDLLNEPQQSTDRKHDNAARAQLIVDTLASFGVDATVVEINEGPTVTQFGVEPGWEVRYKDMPLKDRDGKTLLGQDGRPRTERVEVGRTRVRVNKITALQNDLALALAAPSLRIEAPVPGRAIVGIEVPNDTASVVTMRSVMETKEFRDLAITTKLALALGRGVAGRPVVADLSKMPHLLIAGATGSGKSVCMNSIIAAIMMNATPDQVRFIMVDPKRVELTSFKGIPHLAFSEVIVDVDKVVGALQAVVSEMEARYRKFAELGVRNIEGYNRHPRVMKRLPYWVLIIDELADLMMAAPFEVERLICRLAQLARATGIHLVVATQRPSVDVITGLIKANFPTRIAFAVTSQTDSRTILDSGGAEKLLGRGDMLFMPTDAAKPLRIQGVYMSDAEVERLVEWWKDERFSQLSPENSDDLLEQALLDQNGGDADIEVDDDDPHIELARELASQHSRVSPSMLQRRLRVGYVKACALMDVLAEEGIVGPREDGESRRVLQPADTEGRFSD